MTNASNKQTLVMESAMNAQTHTQNAPVEVADMISSGAYKLVTAIEAAIDAMGRWMTK